jgi:LysM repeat protein
VALEMWKKKAGPLPMWGWGAILLAAALLWSLGKSRSSKQDAAAPTGDEALTVPADQVPDFISQVYATTINNLPAPDGGGGGSASAPPPTSTLPQPITSAPPVTPPAHTTPAPAKPKPVTKGQAKPLKYKVKHGDTLSSIAKKYGTSWQKLWAYNTKAGVRPADTIKTLKERGPSRLYSGETILIPQ